MTASPPKVLLVFPPASDARFFPYLSLPQLAAHLRGRGCTVIMVDLNIELVHALTNSRQATSWAATVPGKDAWRAWEARGLAGLAPQARAQLFDDAERTRGAVTDRAFVVLRRLTERQLDETSLRTPIERYTDFLDRVAALNGAEADHPAVAFIRRRFGDVLDAERPDIVGLSVPFLSQMPAALLIARLAKRHPCRPHVTLGGPAPQRHAFGLRAVPGLLDDIDSLAIGAGEAAFEHIQRGGALRPHNNGTAILAGGVDVRRQPIPDYAGLAVTRYLNPEVHLAITTCLGCWWGRCAFCSYGNMHAGAVGSYQEKSRHQIAAEITDLVERYRPRQINVADENTNLRTLVSVMRRLRREGLAIPWNARCRLERKLTSPAFCEDLAELGCRILFMGFDSTAEHLLDTVDRGVRVADFDAILSNLEAVGIQPRLSLMLGLPGETRAEAEATCRYLIGNFHRVRARRDPAHGA